MLSRLLEMQQQLMKVLGVETKEEAEGALPLSGLLEAAIGLSVESAEVLDEMNKATRPWKPRKVSQEHIVEESIDVLFYLLEIFTLLGMSDTAVLMNYRIKYFYNLARVLSSFTQNEREDAIRNMKNITLVSSNLDVAINLLMKNGYISMGSDFTDKDWEFVIDPLHAI